MSHAQKVLTAAMPAVQELDQMIKQLETNLGKAHSVSPFTGLYAQAGVQFSTYEKKAPPAPPMPPKEEKKVEEAKVSVELSELG